METASGSNSSHKFEPTPLIFGLGAALLLLMLTLASTKGFRIFQSLPNVQLPQVKPASHFLTIDQPEDNFITQNPNLIVKGKTSPGSTVIVMAGEEMELKETTDGNFSFDLTLQEGAVKVEITSFDQNGEEQNVAREGFYTLENP